MYLLRCVVILMALVHTRADCQSAWENRHEQDDCWEYEPGSECPASCQAGFDAVLSTCKEGDDYGIGDGKLFGYKPYTLWVEDFESYPDCNLGMTLDTAPCAALFSIMDEHCDMSLDDHTEPCSKECQDGLDRTMKKCKAGDPTPAGDYSTYNVYTEYWNIYPQCKLGYTPNACDKAVSALEEAANFMKDLQCKKERNGVCSQDCIALIDTLNTECATGPSCFVPTGGYLGGTGEMQKYSSFTKKTFFANSFALSEDCQSKLQDVPADTIRTAADPPCCNSSCPSGTASGESPGESGGSGAPSGNGSNTRLYVTIAIISVVVLIGAFLLWQQLSRKTPSGDAARELEMSGQAA